LSRWNVTAALTSNQPLDGTIPVVPVGIVFDQQQAGSGSVQITYP
jgi:hypothetical protein